MKKIKCYLSYVSMLYKILVHLVYPIITILFILFVMSKTDNVDVCDNMLEVCIMYSFFEICGESLTFSKVYSKSFVYPNYLKKSNVGKEYYKNVFIVTEIRKILMLFSLQAIGIILYEIKYGIENVFFIIGLGFIYSMIVRIWGIIITFISRHMNEVTGIPFSGIITSCFCPIYVACVNIIKKGCEGLEQTMFTKMFIVVAIASVIACVLFNFFTIRYKLKRFE